MSIHSIIVIKAGNALSTKDGLSNDGKDQVVELANILRKSPLLSMTVVVICANTAVSKASANTIANMLKIDAIPNIILNPTKKSSGKDVVRCLSLLDIPLDVWRSIKVLIIVCGGDLPEGITKAICPKAPKTLFPIKEGQGVVILPLTREVEPILESLFLQATEEV